MNGKRISYGKSIGPDSYYVPVYFKFDYNPGLIDGTFADVYLTGALRSNVIADPNTSLMEEFGKFYVFVEDEDDCVLAEKPLPEVLYFINASFSMLFSKSMFC